MAFEHTALRVDLAEDLLPLSALLTQRGLPHRVFEEGGAQVLKVARPEQVDQVLDLYRAWRDGQITIELQRRPAPSRAPLLRAAGMPVTLLLIALSIAGFALYLLKLPLEWLQLLTFTPFTVEAGVLRFYEGSGEYWRLVTPAFLHFGWLHIAFNSLWLWELGGRVERTLGHLNMLGLFLVIATLSNVCQYLFGGPSLFGGMSGVVYGLLGFSWVGARVQPRWAFSPPRPVMLFMLGWLVVCLVGLVEGLGFGAVANAAHLGGLLAGAGLGAVFGIASRYNGIPH